MADPVVITQWAQELDALRERNKQKLLEMAASGIQPEEVSLLHIRLDWLIQSISEAMGESGPEFKLLAHVRWQQALNSQLHDMHREGLKARLAAGTNLSPSAISQLARQTGTPGWGQ